MGTGSVFVSTPGGKGKNSVEDGLIFYVPFDENYDDKIRPESPTQAGAISLVGGQVGGGVNIQKGVLKYLPQLVSAQNELTICFWVLFTQMPTYSTFIAESSSDSSYDFLVRVMGGKFALYINGSYRYSNITIPNLQEWIHIGVTLSKDKILSFYANGVFDSQITNVAYPTTISTGTYIGNHYATLSASQSYNLYGYMDEVRMYKQAKTADEIRAIYQYKGKGI